MPTRKIGDLPGRRECRDPEHNPTSMMVYENGIYEHECPSCHRKQTFVVNKPTLGARPPHCWIGTPDPTLCLVFGELSSK